MITNFLFGHGKKIGTVNLVCGLLNWLYLKNKPMEFTDVLHARTIFHKLKGDQKSLRWRDSKTDCIWRMSRWNKLIFNTKASETSFLTSRLIFNDQIGPKKISTKNQIHACLITHIPIQDNATSNGTSSTIWSFIKTEIS